MRPQKQAFKPVEFWTVHAALTGPGGSAFEAALVEIDGKKLSKAPLGSAAEAQAAAERIAAATLQVLQSSFSGFL